MADEPEDYVQESEMEHGKEGTGGAGSVSNAQGSGLANEAERTGGEAVERTGGVGESLRTYGERVSAAARAMDEDPGRDALHAALEHVVEAVEGHARSLTSLRLKQREPAQRIEARARQLARQARDLIKNQRE